MIEFLDTMYDGWLGRASLTAIIIGGVLLLIGMIAAEETYSEWPENVAFVGFLMWLMSGGVLAVWCLVRLLTWMVTGE